MDANNERTIVIEFTDNGDKKTNVKFKLNKITEKEMYAGILAMAEIFVKNSDDKERAHNFIMDCLNSEYEAKFGSKNNLEEEK